jgi:phospholipid/cholesterol/gamma-HCH transport system substrate-binding protein
VPPVRAGLLAIVLIATASWLAFKGTPFHTEFDVKARLASGNELHARSPVRIAGVEVGRVKKLERGPGRTALVTLALKKEALPLHEDATLKVRPRIFLEGNFFVDLRPGTPSAPVMHEGYTIPLAHTAIPVQLDQILSTLQSSTRDDLRTLLHEYARAMDGGGAIAFNRALRPSRRAFAGSAIVAEASRGQEAGDLARYIDAGGATAEAVARTHQLGALVSGLNGTLRALATHREALARSIPELDALLREAGPSLLALNNAFPAARALVRAARPGVRQLPATLRLANPLLDQVLLLTRPVELPALLDQLEPAVVSLARLEPKLVRLFSLVTPVTECLRLNAVPTLKKKVDDDALSTNEPVYRELLYALVGLASASQNFDGNGPAVRYHAGFGDQIVTTGHAPSAGEPLVGLTSEPILGSRPLYTAKPPPFKPHVPCVSQKPPNLAARTGPAPSQRPVP